MLRNSFDDKRPVLIVDDSQMLRVAARGSLHKLGFSFEQILLAADATSALEFARTSKIQLLLCDYNLNDKINGHQLLDQLINDNLLPADCVVVIITGDSSPETVRGFAELEPDGYLIKPFSFETVRDRLPKMGKRKKVLGPILRYIKNQDFDQAIDLADKELASSATSLKTSIFLAKAKALHGLKQYDAAQTLLNALLKGPHKVAATLELARIALSQADYDRCLKLLDPLEADPMNCAQALDISSRACLHLNQLPEAMTKAKNAIHKSPNKLERYLYKGIVALASLDLEAALATLQRGIQLARYTFRESLRLYQVCAMLTLDLAQVSPARERKKLISSFGDQCKFWRTNFARNDYKPLELLMMVRAHNLGDQPNKAKACMKEYDEWRHPDDHTPVPEFEKYEKAQICIELSDAASFEKLMDDLESDLSDTPDNFESIALKLFISRWRAWVNKMREEVTKLKQKSKELFEAGEYEQAVSKLVHAMELDHSDPDVPYMLIRVFNYAWPQGWTRERVTQCSIECYKLLKGGKYENRKEYREALESLTSVLKVPEHTFTR